jgi:hypothetical protein
MLDKALELHAMHHFMTTIIEFTDESAVTVARQSENLLGDHYRQDRYDSSRLLGRQLKHAMHDLQEQQTETLLEDLERCLRKKERDEWPTWFCVLIILCLATEDVQVAIDNFVVNNKLIINDSEVFHELRESHQDCWNLEDKLSHQFTQLFHDVFQTHKRSDGFNPILDDRRSEFWSQSTKAMLREIRQLMQDFSKQRMHAIFTSRLIGSRFPHECALNAPSSGQEPIPGRQSIFHKRQPRPTSIKILAVFPRPTVIRYIIHELISQAAHRAYDISVATKHGQQYTLREPIIPPREAPDITAAALYFFMNVHSQRECPRMLLECWPFLLPQYSLCILFRRRFLFFICLS